MAPISTLTVVTLEIKMHSLIDLLCLANESPLGAIILQCLYNSTFRPLEATVQYKLITDV